MTAREFAEWQAYDRLDPFGEERGDLRNAVLCQLIAGLMAGKGKKPTVDDFMPQFEKAHVQQTQAQISETLVAWATNMNALHKSGARPR